jgi:hypothetical protein
LADEFERGAWETLEEGKENIFEFEGENVGEAGFEKENEKGAELSEGCRGFGEVGGEVESEKGGILSFEGEFGLGFDLDNEEERGAGLSEEWRVRFEIGGLRGAENEKGTGFGVGAKFLKENEKGGLGEEDEL